MATVNDINGFLSNFEDLIAAIIAENCSEMYKWGRKLIRKNYKDESDPEATGTEKKETVEKNYNYARDWFLDPRSEFNTYWKDMMALCKHDHTNSILDGKQIVNALTNMIEDTESFPEDSRSFRQEKKGEDN